MNIIDEVNRRHRPPHVTNIWYDIDKCLATFPLYDVNGRLTGYQQYNPTTTEKKTNDPRSSRYFTYQPPVKNTGWPVCWGLEYIEHRDTLFITEGVFEAMRLIGMGYDAVAILTSNPHPLMVTQLYGLGYTRIVWCGDNDDAGRKSKIIPTVDDVMFFEKDIDELEYDVLELTLIRIMEKQNDCNNQDFS